MMNVVYERRHAHVGGVIVASVHESADGIYAASACCYTPDGASYLMAFGSHHRSVIDAQRDADREVVHVTATNAPIGANHGRRARHRTCIERDETMSDEPFYTPSRKPSTRMLEWTIDDRLTKGRVTYARCHAD